MQKYIFFLLLNASSFVFCSQNVEKSTFKYVDGKMYSPYGGYILNTTDGYFSTDVEALQQSRCEVDKVYLLREIEDQYIRINKERERLKKQIHDNCFCEKCICRIKLLKRRPRCWSTPDGL